MKVELRNHEGRTVRGKTVRFDQYRIFVDGKAVGYLGFQENAKILLLTRFSPIDLKEIERQCRELTEGPKEIVVNQIADIPEELLKPKTKEIEDDLIDDVD